MAREREFDPTQALDRAVALFWERGYSETSMEDLVDTTGVSRYGIYGTFGNKRELFIAALRRYAHLMAVDTRPGLFLPGAGLAELKGFFRAMLKRASGPEGQRGCMICNTAIDLAPHDENIAAAVRGLFDELTSVFTTALTNAQAAGDVNKSLDPKATAELLVGLLQGAAVFARTGTSITRLKRYGESAMAILE
jgi:TetR/AcrR family transcriptional repressor of nem operon